LTELLVSKVVSGCFKLLVVCGFIQLAEDLMVAYKCVPVLVVAGATDLEND
jgi:hypothetical protein